jgi:hypothetical protein
MFIPPPESQILKIGLIRPRLPPSPPDARLRAWGSLHLHDQRHLQLLIGTPGFRLRAAIGSEFRLVLQHPHPMLARLRWLHAPGLSHTARRR